MIVKYNRLLGVGPDGEPLIHLINPGEMVKTASGLIPEVDDFIKCLRPDPRYTYVLVNAMGYSEYYGSNANKDWYGYNPHLDFNGLLHAPEDWGCNPAKDRERGKLWAYGYPTYYGASVYAHHQNKDPEKYGFGDIIFVAPNHKMKRIELVKRIDNTRIKARGRGSILDRIRHGERVDVSMGCFKAGARVSMSDGTMKLIEDIEVGDWVRTHTGDVGKVTELHRRKYRGEFFEIKPANSPAFHATSEHPFWAAYKAKDAHRVWQEEKPEFDWHFATSLDGAVLSRPKILKESSPSFAIHGNEVARAWARLIGYYLAEGHIVFNKAGKPCGVELTVNKTDTVNDEIEDLCRVLQTNNAPVWRQRENSEASWSIQIYDDTVPVLCQAYAGRYSKTKQLDEEVLYWPHELQLELLGAYGNGDGFASKDGSFSFSTASVNLASQLREILFRLGIPTSHNTLTHKAGSGFSITDTTEHVVFLGRQWAPRLRDYCSKIVVREVRQAKNIFKDYGDLWAVPIREFEQYYDEADVYNFEVEGDNSYIVNGVAAHNCKVPFDLCSICTDWEAIQKAWDTFDPQKHLHPGIAILRYHKDGDPIRGLSITKDDYCEHMKTQGGKILPDGQKVFVYNDFPRFFDNSFVWIGADKTARVMWFMSADMPSQADILARQSMPRIVIKDRTIIVKTAMEKVARSPVKLSEIDKEIPGGIAHQVRLRSFTEPDIDQDVLEHSSKIYGIKRLLSTLAALGIVLKPGEFQHIVTASKPMGDQINGMLNKKSALFDTSLMKVADDFAVGREFFDSGLAGIFSEVVPERSSFAPHLGPRCVSPWGQAPTKVAHAVRTDYLDGISAQYNGYRISILERAPELFPKYAEVYPLDPSSLIKASQGGMGALLLGLAPMVHLISSHLRERESSGKDLGTVGKFVADNPSFTRALTIGAGLRAAMGIQSAGGLGGIAAKLIGMAAEKFTGGSGLVQALGTVARAM